MEVIAIADVAGRRADLDRPRAREPIAAACIGNDRRHVGRRLPLHPELERGPIEGRNDPLVPLPGVRRAPDDAGAARAEQPLVAARDEEVAAKIGERFLFHTETVHAVDAEEHAVRLGALLVDVAHRHAEHIEAHAQPRGH